MDVARLTELWHRIFGIQHLSPSWVVLASALLALAAVVPRRAWLISRNVVTIAHEGGHAIAALATGRRLAGIRLHANTAGETLSAGSPDGLGMMLTIAAGYLAPPLLGLGAAGLLDAGHPLVMLLASLILLTGLTAFMRNGYGLAATAMASAGVLLICWLAPPLVQALFAYSATWFLLLGAVRPVLELQRVRRRSRTRFTDADELARLTGVPGVIWVGVFGIVSLAALALGARWLLS